MSDNPIRICIANKRAFIWDVDDIAKIRADHHMCGLLAGTLPHLSQQNMFLGVPLLLMPEEVVLLVENGSAVLLDDPRSYPDPTTPQFKRWLQGEHENRKQQLAAFTSKGLKDGASNRSMSEEAIKKRKERELKKQQKAAQLQQLVSTDDVESPPPLIPEDESQPPTTATTTPANILIPALSSSLEWYSPEQHIYDSIGAAKAAGVWDFPATLQERARCGVYRDLWEQGYFIGIGIKFGAEYLVYPGDPLRYHSHFAATVIDSPNQLMRPMEIVAHGRLGTATKKTHLLCCWDDETKKVTHLSIEWAGFG